MNDATENALNAFSVASIKTKCTKLLHCFNGLFVLLNGVLFVFILFSFFLIADINLYKYV
jgi:hypothetical protein